jgi:hypothetical protein
MLLDVIKIHLRRCACFQVVVLAHQGSQAFLERLQSISSRFLRPSSSMDSVSSLSHSKLPPRSCLFGPTPCSLQLVIVLGTGEHAKAGLWILQSSSEVIHPNAGASFRRGARIVHPRNAGRSLQDRECLRTSLPILRHWSSIHAAPGG